MEKQENTVFRNQGELSTMAKVNRQRKEKCSLEWARWRSPVSSQAVVRIEIRLQCPEEFIGGVGTSQCRKLLSRILAIKIVKELRF